MRAALAVVVSLGLMLTIVLVSGCGDQRVPPCPSPTTTLEPTPTARSVDLDRVAGDYAVVIDRLVEEVSPADIGVAKRVLDEEIGSKIPYVCVPGNHEVMGGPRSRTSPRCSAMRRRIVILVGPRSSRWTRRRGPCADSGNRSAG